MQSPRHGFYYLLRSLGLRIVAQLPLLRGCAWKTSEGPKPIIRTSLLAAFAQSTVHLLPALTSLTVISLNLGHLYLGRTIPGPVLDNTITIAIFQVLAKFQELLIIASLATIVFSRIRQELASGDGVPLGLICSGFMFSQPSYFWSPEFWGALGSGISVQSKLSITALLLVSGLVAATAGPSSAILLVPRQQSWSAGGSEFYLRGTASTLFPTNLTASGLDPPAVCFTSKAVNHAACPSGGFKSLSSYVAQLPLIRNGANLRPPPRRVFGQFANQTVDISSVTPGIPRTQLVGNIRGIACQTSVIAPYIAAIMYQSSLKADWEAVIGDIPWDPSKIWTASSAEYRYNYGASVATSTRIPAVRTACSIGKMLQATDDAVLFPVLPQSACWTDTRLAAVASLNNTPSDRLRATWTRLPETFGATSSGLVIEAPWSMDKSSRVVVGCSIDARWADGTVDGLQGAANHTAPSELWGRTAELDTPFRPPPPPEASWNRIELDDSWLRVLAPAVEDSTPGDAELSLLEWLLMESATVDDSFRKTQNQADLWNSVTSGSSNRTLYLEWITALLVADGISRYGAHNALDMSGERADFALKDYRKQANFESEILRGGQAINPPAGAEYTAFKMDITIQGLSYQAQSITDFLAIAILLIHILLALGHTLYLLVCRTSSSAWDSITEVLTLALNSRTAHHILANTSAGIDCLHTFGKVVIVRATDVVGSGSATNDSQPRRVELLLRQEVVDSGITHDDPTPRLPDHESSQPSRVDARPISPLGRISDVSFESIPGANGSSMQPLLELPQSGRPGSSRSSRVRARPNHHKAYTRIIPDHCYS